MEISPISGIRVLPVWKTPTTDPELAGVFDIENFARIGDETYSPSENRSANNFSDDDDNFDEKPAGQQMESAMAVYESRFGRRISIFA
jgi:hypothetical protein